MVKGQAVLGKPRILEAKALSDNSALMQKYKAKDDRTNALFFWFAFFGQANQAGCTSKTKNCTTHLTANMRLFFLTPF